MKAVIFVLIILGVIFTYALIDEVASNGNFSSPFGLEKRVETEKEATTEIYYSSANQVADTPKSTPHYIGKVKIDSVREATEQHPSLIRLSVRPLKGEPINLTGWTIKTRKGTFNIPKGMEKYQKSGTSRSIVISESMSVYLIGDIEPFGTRKNFRFNKCFGYLSKSEDLYPSSYNYCEAPELEDLEGFTPYCKEYLINQRGCEMPNYSEDFKISTDSKCVSYILNYFTYNGCFNRYSKEDDFLSDYWYIYVNKNIVEELHDTIYLYDQNNNLIDKYSY